MKLNAWELLTIENALAAKLASATPDTRYHQDLTALFNKVQTMQPKYAQPRKSQAVRQADAWRAR